MTGIIHHENWIAALPPSVAEAIRARMTVVEVPAGSIVKRAGDLSEALFQVERGFVRMLGLHRDGRQVLILIYREGNVFGETPMVARRGFTHTTVALTDARLLRLAEPDFWQLYRAHPEIPESLCRKFAANSTRLLDFDELRSTMRLREQIVSMLSNIADHAGKPGRTGGVDLVLPISQTDIADHLQVTRQAVQREMSSLQEIGVIGRIAGKWCVHQ